MFLSCKILCSILASELGKTTALLVEVRQGHPESSPQSSAKILIRT